MIDLHCHVLPGIDDGPTSTEEAVHLASRAAQDGITTIAATPHLRSDHPGVEPTELNARSRELEQALAAAGHDLGIVPAGEVDLVWALDAPDDELRLVTYGQRGTDVLLESPYGTLSPSFEQFLFERFSARGIRVLLAHPERNPTFREDPKRLADLVRRGVLVQVTANSLANRKRRSQSRRLAMHLIEEGLAHVMASDSHGTYARAPLSAGVAEASRIDPARAEWMVTEAPAAILAGEPLPPPPVARPTARRRFRRRSP